MFDLLIMGTKKKYSKKEAIRAVKRFEKSGKRHTLHDFAKAYNGDFEDVFREAVGEMGIECYAYTLERIITHGKNWAGNTTNELQRDRWDFEVYSLALYMIDRDHFLPLLLLDNELIASLNMAANDLGYDAIYTKNNPLRVCINQSKQMSLNKFKFTDEETALVQKAKEECKEYLGRSEKIEQSKAECEREKMEGDMQVPHWMQVVHKKWLEDHADDEEDE